MIIVNREIIGQIPILHIAKKELWEKPLPFIMFIHGFTSAKEHNLHYAYYLAEKGFRVALPECEFHGERKQELKEETFMLSFWSIVIQNIKELDLIRQSFLERSLIDHHRIGVAGTSMGAITTLGALTVYPWIKVAVSLMGAPGYVQFANMQIEMIKSQGYGHLLNKEQVKKQLEDLRTYDLSLHPEALNERPLLFWHGKKDPVVPFENAWVFYQTHASDNDHLQFLVDEKAGHKVTRQGVLETVKWLERYL